MGRPRLIAAFLTIVLFNPISCGSQYQVRGGSAHPDGNGMVREFRDEILAAVSASYRLDDQLWSERERIRSRDDLVQYFRTGFGRLQAEKLAAYFWVGGMDPPLRSSEPVLVMPEAMKVETVSSDRAEVLLHYAGRSTGTVTWEAHTVLVLLLNEDGIWKIHQADPVLRR